MLANAPLAGIAGGGTLRATNGEVTFSIAVFTTTGAGENPFLLQVEDLGAPGSDEGQFNLVLGADAEPFISAAQAPNYDCGGFPYG